MNGTTRNEVELTKSTQESSSRAPVPTLVHISGQRRGTTERLPDATVRIDPAPSGIALVEADESEASQHFATLHPNGQTYELAVAPHQTIWVNGELVQNKILKSGDLLEIGDGGPVLRYRLYSPGEKIYKSVKEALADCLDCFRHEHRSLPGRIALFFIGLTRELTTQTSMRIRLTMLAVGVVFIAMLVLTTALLTRQSLDLESRLAAEQTRVSELSKLITRVQDKAFDRQELVEMRSVLESGLSQTTRRLEQLEARPATISGIIEAASQSTVFIQGSFGFEDPGTSRPLRLLLGPEGQPLRSRQGQPAVTLEGEGPVFEINYTGTAFLVGPDGQLLTNRHVALPWENDDSYKGVTALGLRPAMHRLIGYLPGIEEPFDVELLAASDNADIAILRCGGVTGLRPPLKLSENAATPGDDVIVLGYPTGIRALLARTGKAFIDNLMAKKDMDIWAVARFLSEAGHIKPLATRGIVGQATSEAVVYDAETTGGGSGGPVIGLNGEVVAVNKAILPEFGGSNLGVPVKHVRELLANSAL